MLHICLVYIIDMSGFVEEIKKKVAFKGRLRPFDCSKCMSFWTVSLCSFFFAGFDPIVSVLFGVLFAMLAEMETTQKLIIGIFLFLQILVDKMMFRIDKFARDDR